MLSIEGLKDYELIVTAAYNAGFRGTPLVVVSAIAQAESKGDPNAIGDVTLETEKWGPSIGLWQVRSLHHPEEYSGADKLRIESKLYDPQYNANISYLISEKGTNFTPWSTYTANEYRKYLTLVVDTIDRLKLG